VLACPACDIKVEGPFQLNEFATLAQDDLHFLRIFVRCEGRIRDMEAALGLSYPTIRGRLSALKHKLAGEDPAGSDSPAGNSAAGASSQNTASDKESGHQDAGRILERLQAGEIPFEEAMKQIKQLRADPR
jgi:hypothetical protein